MHKLLSLPENLVPVFHRLTGKSPDDYFAVSDPAGSRVGSGGGTAWAIAGHMKALGYDFESDYLQTGKRIIIHGGGQGRRLPAYAPSGKLLTPVPVFRWSRGQRLDQNLLDLQVPVYERIIHAVNGNEGTLVASGDVLVIAPDLPIELPRADVLCFGIWADPHMASRHGVFFTRRNAPGELDFMLQKPGHGIIENMAGSHLFLMDIGIWILSNRAVELLLNKCGFGHGRFQNRIPGYYDMYGTFGTGLGQNPSHPDELVSNLTVKVISLPGVEFYHFGTSSELILSTERIQNRILDQRSIWHFRVKPHPSLFIQNSLVATDMDEKHHHIWIENSHIPSTWTLHHNHVITGIPENKWMLDLPAGICLDMVPVGGDQYCLRPYGIEDPFKGNIRDADCLWMGRPIRQWFSDRGIASESAGFRQGGDIQLAPIFPVMPFDQISDAFIQWMVSAMDDESFRMKWMASARLSADQIGTRASLEKLFAQRTQHLQKNLAELASNHKHSVFYQSDLKHAAGVFMESGMSLPEALSSGESAMIRIRDYMFRSECKKLQGADGHADESAAFGVLRDFIAHSVQHRAVPRLSISPDQIVWGRSPARLDMAGGWSDTPPYCLQNGGSVVNMAVELNGQPPIQVYIRQCPEAKIILRSIDNGVSEELTQFEELMTFHRVGSAFSIPKAALCMAGFHPDFCAARFTSLAEQLKELGGGLEISLLAAIPKGSGLGTSSILAATLLGTLSDCYALGWDHQDICHRTLVLEQLLTTGGGWQDQYGGILRGIKLLETEPGTQEKVRIKWLPDQLFSYPGYQGSWMLYYTGITRVAKNILAEIVRGMFLNEGQRLRILDEIRHHAYAMADAIQRSDLNETGRMVHRSWLLNNALDSGTSTPEVQHIIEQIGDLSLGLKLLGAGGGGYLLICAQDPEAAGRIHTILQENPVNKRARFVKMDVSLSGFQTSRT